jgi:hypothetical protein
MKEINYEERVAKGIALLDEKFPNWAGLIDLERLSIADGSRCVTAQLAQGHGYGASFVQGMEMLGLEDGRYNDGSYTEHGFNAECSTAEGMPPGYSQWDMYDTLTLIWQREISARQGQADG